MIDTYTKTVLTVIAVALTVLVLKPVFAVNPAHADSYELSSIQSDVSSIESDVSSIQSAVSSIQSDVSSMSSYLRRIESDLDDIEDGTCLNGKIC